LILASQGDSHLSRCNLLSRGFKCT